VRWANLLAIEADGKILTSGNGLMGVNIDATVDTSFNPTIIQFRVPQALDRQAEKF